MLFILLTGMPGSGKSIFLEVVRNEFKIPVYTMGDIVREVVVEKYGSVSTMNMLITAIELRNEYGSDYIARKTYERVDKKSEVVIIDGVRSLNEIYFFREKGEVIIVAIHASPTTRFNRLLNRNRPGDPKSWEEFKYRDNIELSLGIGNVIALADFIIVNESTVEDFRVIIRETLVKILSKRGLI